MQQVEELLLVEVLQFRVPDAYLSALIVEDILAAAEVEAVRGECASPVQRHVFHARIVAWAVAAELPAVQRQAVDFLGGDLTTAKRLRQRTTVIGAQDRQHRHPLADLQFGLGNPRLARHAQTPEIIGWTTIAVDRQQLSATRTLAAIELERIQAQHVNPETHHTLGEARLGVENEALRPFLGLVLWGRTVRESRVGEVAVEVGITQVERGLGIVDETFGHAKHREYQRHAADAQQDA